MTVTERIWNKIEDCELLTNPFDHLVVDDFLPQEYAIALSNEFMDYNDERWHKYSNTIEEKRTCNQWNLFQSETYKYFEMITSPDFCEKISKKFMVEVSADVGLHGGGQHIHASMGNLNPHLDYSIHPKNGKERRLNAIFYLSDEYEEEDGGHFGLWENNSSEYPGSLIKEYSPKFNRLVIFNTSQNSWHGLSKLYNPKGEKYRKSLATYYLSIPRTDALTHTRAKFAPREEQKNDPKVNKEIADRVTEGKHKNIYVTKE